VSAVTFVRFSKGRTVAKAVSPAQSNTATIINDFFTVLILKDG
jgi:hypothetical protein